MPKDNKPLEGITPTQQRFIEALLTGSTIIRAAHLAGVSQRTAFYWMAKKDGPVRCEYERQLALAQKELQDRVARLHNLTFQALEDMLSPKNPPFIRMQAVKLLYESHLESLFKVQRPQSPSGLVSSGLEHYQKEQQREGLNGVMLWDDRGNERIPEE